MIKFKNVFIKYVQDFYSLYNFSCDINTNTIFLSDSFDETTSILRILAKIDKRYKGDVYVDNINLRNISNKDLDVAYLPKTPVLFQNKNIFKNLYFPLKIRKINKYNAKNMIKKEFLELKNNNFNFLNNELKFAHNKDHLKEEDIIDNFLKLKVKKLNLSEKKIITLIRALLRKPKYILLENFFESLNDKQIQIVKFLLTKLKETSTIIACEKEFYEAFKDFKIINLTNKKKED